MIWGREVDYSWFVVVWEEERTEVNDYEERIGVDEGGEGPQYLFLTLSLLVVISSNLFFSFFFLSYRCR